VNEINKLTRFRTDIPEMSERARIAGALRLREEFTRPAGRVRVPLRRVALPAGTLAVVLAGLLGYQTFGPAGQPPTASAAVILEAAANTVDQHGYPHPRSDQYIYREVLHVIGNGEKTLVRSWESADGTRAGEIRWSGYLTNTVAIPPYHEGDGLSHAPYTRLAELPTDPDELLRILRNDPQVLATTPHPAPNADQITPDLRTWDVIRDLVGKVPGPQQAALFRAAAKLPGLTRVDQATDAAGRSGVGIAMADPRLGLVELLFDKESHRFLGEPVLSGRDKDAIEFNDTVVRTAVVDKVGQLP